MSSGRRLAAVRQDVIRRGWCRTIINRRVERVRRAFRWAASEKLVPVTVHQAQRTLSGLQKGRTAARESEPVTPADPAHVRATLLLLSAHVHAMAELQLLTGMRPGEACALTLGDIDRAGPVWVYRPPQHKTAHRGKERAVPLGPRAQALLLAFLARGGAAPAGFEGVDPNDLGQRKGRRAMAAAYRAAGLDREGDLLADTGRPVVVIAGRVADPAAPLFSPAQARAEWARAARAARRSKVPPSQRNRRTARPARSPGAGYSVAAYGYAVRKAAGRAGVPHWHPNQLRHAFATAVRKARGLEAAQVLLGHARADVTQVYAERDLALAAAVAAELG